MTCLILDSFELYFQTPSSCRSRIRLTQSQQASKLPWSLRQTGRQVLLFHNIISWTILHPARCLRMIFTSLHHLLSPFPIFSSDNSALSQTLLGRPSDRTFVSPLFIASNCSVFKQLVGMTDTQQGAQNQQRERRG